MKNTLIVAMICVNLILVAVLAFHATATPAQAQTRLRGSAYTMITGAIGTDWDAVYVIDLKTNRMAAWIFDKTRKSLTPYVGRDLERDFRSQR